MNRRFISLFILSFVLFTGITHAQMPTLSSTGLDLTASSNNPIPGQTVTITANSYNADVDTSQITWVVNGKLSQSGIGLKELKVKAPALGKKLSIDVSAVTTSGRKMISNIVVGSGSVDLIIETDGYVPPLFLGKIAPVYQNKVTVIAMPHIADSSGNEYNPNELVYQWKKNDSVIADQSGYGKQSVSIKGTVLPRPYTLTVSVSSKDAEGQAAGSVDIDYQSPFAKFYVDDSLYGILFNRTIRSGLSIGTSRETGVHVTPFGFNGPSNDINNLTYTWSINSTEHPELSTNDSITLRAPDSSDGSSNVAIDIHNSKEILQGISDDFTVKFKKNTDSTKSAVTF